MKSLACLVALSLLWGASALSSDWHLVWSDEFDGSQVDTSKWTFVETCSPHNDELQCYTDRTENAQVEDGHLTIRVKNEKYGGKKFTSARIYSQCDPKGSWYHGRFEMKAKLPNAKHLWPAFWLIPADEVYGGWPKSGEIDIMEYRGQETSKMSSAMHFGSPHKYVNTGPQNFPGKDFSSGYHTFALEWSEKKMVYYVDDKEHWAVGLDKNWGSMYKKNIQPWDQRFHMIINVAVGGNFFKGYPALTQKDIDNWKDPTMVIDYVRVYQRDGVNNDPPHTGAPGSCGVKKETIIWAVVGSVVGVIAIVGVIVAVVCVRKRRRNNADRLTEMTDSNRSSGSPVRSL